MCIFIQLYRHLNSFHHFKAELAFMATLFTNGVMFNVLKPGFMFTSNENTRFPLFLENILLNPPVLM